MRAQGLALVIGLGLLGCGDDSTTSTTEADSGTRTGGSAATTDGGEATGGTASSGGPAGSSGAGSSGEGSGSSGGASSSETGCVPVTEDAGAIGSACEVDDECPDGYVCQDFIGAVLERSCQIRCEQDCECPMGHQCVEVMDKEHAWRECSEAS